VPAGIAVNARKAVVRVTAIDKTLDYALFDRALKPARIAQFLRVALRALPQRTRPRVAGAVYGASPRRAAALRAGLPLTWVALPSHTGRNAPDAAGGTGIWQMNNWAHHSQR